MIVATAMLIAVLKNYYQLINDLTALMATLNNATIHPQTNWTPTVNKQNEIYGKCKPTAQKLQNIN